MSGQRARSAVPADHRSAHPNFPGLPWWGAMLLAVTATAMGFAFDAGSSGTELSAVFAGFYVLGCLAAVLAVRQVGLFTAVIQPPLILFVSVPSAYFLLHGAQITSIKDTLINCGYPLIERFPLMFFTSAAVLLIGLARWYYAMSTRKGTAKSADGAKATGKTGNTKAAAAAGMATGAMTMITSKISGLVNRDHTEDEIVEPEPQPQPQPRRRRPAAEHSDTEHSATAAPGRRPAKATKATKPGPGRRADTAAPAGADSARAERRTARRTPPPPSRHTRPPEPDRAEPGPERPRRPRPPRGDDDMPPPPPPPRRRPRPEPGGDPRREPRRDPRREPGREPRRVPPAERRPAAEPRERREPPREPRERRPAAERRPRRDDYPPSEPQPVNGNGTHHPISRVRYRRSEDGDTRTENRSRPRSARNWQAETWEYDI